MEELWQADQSPMRLYLEEEAKNGGEKAFCSIMELKELSNYDDGQTKSTTNLNKKTNKPVNRSKPFFV